jgi:hypothetical protein
MLQKGADLALTTWPADEMLDGTKGRTTRRFDYGGHHRCYAASSLAAGPSPLRQPERRQLTHDHDHEVA